MFSNQEIAEMNRNNAFKGQPATAIPGWPGEVGVYGDVFQDNQGKVWIAVEVPATATTGAIKTAVDLSSWFN